MKKVNSLILLINTLSKAEKKAIYLYSNLTKGTKVYMELFMLIDRQKIVDSEELYKEFKANFSKASFHPVVGYLYDFVLSVLVRLKVAQDKEFSLHQKLLTAKVLAERNLDIDYYATLQQLKEEAKEISNYHILLLIKRMELDYLRTNGFNDITENELLRKQHKTNDTVKIIRQINEQSSLYELLTYRIDKSPSSQSATHTQYFNDLIVSEISLVSNLNRDVFEVQKLHQLFQAQYLIHVGDYKSALNSFIELDKLFGDNPDLWNNPPLYYASVLEGILESLKRIEKYEQMEYFSAKLKQLEHPSIPFQTEIECIRFIYSVAPCLDKGDWVGCNKMVDKYNETLISKIDLLNPYRYMQLSLTLSAIYLLDGKQTQARRQLTRIINSDSYRGIWLYRPIQLMNLIVHYELGNIDIIISRIRSIKRRNKIDKKASPLEDILFHFLNTDLITMSDASKNKLRKKIEKEFEHLEDSNEDRRVLSTFNFKRWMLSHL